MKKSFLCLIITLFLFSDVGYCAEVHAPSKVVDISKETLDDEKALTLEDCYQLALKQSELIAIDAEKIKQAEAHFLSAFEGLLPEVAFTRTDTRQNSNRFPTSNHGFDQKFVFTQTLFSGFKEYAGMASGHYETKQQKYFKLRAEQLLFQDVSDAFYLLIEKQEDLKVLATIRKALADRIEELNSRVSIGKSRTSEVVFTESQLYNLESSIEFVKGQELVARELMEFLIGRRFGSVTETEVKFELKPEAEYLAEAHFRADVESTKFAWKSDQKQVMVAQSGFLPQINFEGSTYGHRSSSPQDAEWDAMLTADIPIFEEHATYGGVKEAIAIAKEAELMYARTIRIAAQEIHDAYVNMQSSIAVYTALEKAVKSAELNFSLQTKDYQLNVVNNLDVLTSIQNLGNVQRSYIQALYESKRLYWQLLVAAGEIGE